MNPKPYLIVSALLGAALVLSVALGAVTIPPGDALQILADKIPGLDIQLDLPIYYEKE